MNDLENFYKEIRQENKKGYGTKIDIYGPKLLNDLYSDRTHFVYEILQNTEDACERAVNKNIEREFYISFELEDDRLEIRHNGIPFTKEDVKGICGLGEGTKTDDNTQIGKFGIGFKSVYAYTNTPKIHSGDKHFKIKDYVHPEPIDPQEDLEKEETLIILPFDKECPNYDPKKEIGNRLEALGLENLLFLQHLTDISWKRDYSNGNYKKSVKEIREDVTKVKTKSESFLDENKTVEKEWLIFTNKTQFGEDDLEIEIAFKLDDGSLVELGEQNSKLSSYFLTDKSTHLNFIVQAPFKTTTSRDNILEEDEKNIFLMDMASSFIKECIDKIKNQGFLNVEFLKILPVEKKENKIYMMFYKNVKEKLKSGEKLFPTNDGEFASYEESYLAREKGLINLLPNEKLASLMGEEKAKWIDKKITRNKTKKLWEYLINEIDIPMVNVEKFAKNIDKNFLTQQTDEWIKEFYKFLNNHEALWQSWRDDPIIREKPIIRLENNKHIIPFQDDNAQAYLPPENEEFYKHFDIVKAKICKDEKAKEFLKELGLSKPDRVEALKKKVLNRYRKYGLGKSISMSELKRKIDVGEEQNKNHVEWIINTLKNINNEERKDELINELQKRAFLYAENMTGSKKGYKTPEEIYLSNPYMGNDNIDIFFKNNEGIFSLSERYKDIGDIDFFKKIGCKTDIEVDSRESKRIVIKNRHGQHERAIDYFDPSASIDGLEHALENITLERAKIIWNLLKKDKNYKKIFGTVEKATRKDYSNLKKIEKYSEMGELLCEYKWVPNNNKEFCKPSDILLSEVHDSLRSSSSEAEEEIIANKLSFKTKAEDELVEKLPTHKRKLFETIEDASKDLSANQLNEFEDKIKNYIEQIKDKTETDHSEISEDEIKDKFKNNLESDDSKNKRKKSSDKKQWDGMNPEDEESLREQYGKKIPERLNEIEMERTEKTITKTKIRDTINPKEFLIEQYDGHCQICNTKIDVGGEKPYIETFRIFETKGKNQWTNMEFNILGLCPNCHARLKHGSKDLSNIIKVAKRVANNDIAPEPVAERQGDYYIIDIDVLGRQKELFYTPDHMNRFASFLKPTNTPS